MLRDKCIFFEEGAYSQGARDPSYCEHFRLTINECDKDGEPCNYFCDKETIRNLLSRFFREY